MICAEKADLLRQIAQERILVKDGPYGTADPGLSPRRGGLPRRPRLRP